MQRHTFTHISLLWWVFAVCLLGQTIWHQQGALKSLFVVCSFTGHRPCVHCTHAQTVQCRAEGSVMDSPEHVCVVANALRQGTWLTTAPEGAQNQREPMQPTASSTKPPLERGKAPNAQSSYNCQRQLHWLFQIIFMLEFILLKWSWIVVISYGLRGLSESAPQLDIILCSVFLCWHWIKDTIFS